MEFVHLLLYLGVLFTFINTNNSNSDVSKTKSSSLSLSSAAAATAFFEENKEFEDDEIQRRGGKSPLGWSAWSDFSTCSRTCDGGVAFQLRRCHSPQGCKGESVRYKICNMQACPDQQDFRAQQCAAYNDVPYDGALFNWTPHYDYSEPCALTCRGRPEHLRDEKKSEEHDSLDEESEEASVIVQLSNRVQDGTRCRPGSLDICIQGKCQRVGCDLKIGSTKKIDSCGVCGGDGSTCSEPLYHWEIAPMSLCSVTCGGGYKMSLPMCKNRLTNAGVEESLCNHASRPEPTVVQCNTHACPPKWISDEWGPCNKTCGGGIKERIVVCAEESNGARHRVPDEACRGIRPKTQESCNTHDCPKWVTSDWSGCSSSCGTGMQIRSVECVDLNDMHNTQCDPATRPNSMQSCSVGIPCIDDIMIAATSTTTEFYQELPSSDRSNINDDDTRDSIDKNFDDLTAEEEEESEERDIETNRQRLSSMNNGDDETEEDDEDDNDRMQADDPTERNSQQPFGYQYRMPRAERLIDPHKPNEPTFVPGDWGPCSVTCGDGLRRRRYECKIFLEFSKVIATIDDSKCHGIRPADDYERCFAPEPCSLGYGAGVYDDNYRSRDRVNNDQIKVQAAVPGKSYSWRDEGYTACSASCLGGVEELIINCVRDDTGKVVSPYLCSPETKPENRIRTCNDIPCPPRWNYSDYSPCTKSCGIGIKTREINCIHEVTRGGENTMIVPNSMCPQPPPSDRQYCNVLDCPARWEVGEWSRCSKACGGGYKNRTVVCKQTMAQDHKVGRLDSMCPGLKPPDKKLCNTKPCPPEDDRPIISANDGGKYIQHDASQKKISLKVGGAAQVFYGVQVKIKCPVKKYNRTKIKWSKDHNYLPKSRKYKVSKKGALRILDVTFKDGGVYTCHAGLSGADIQLTIKPKPGEFPSSEESERGRDSSGRFKYSDSPQTTVHGRNSSHQRTRQRNRTRNKHVNDNPANGDGRLTKTGEEEFLLPLQAFRSSKGHQMLHHKLLKYAIDPGERGAEQEDDPHAVRHVEKSITDSLDFEFYVGPWSACSQTCGINDSGYRLRSVHCMVRVKNTTKNVDNILCEDAGLKSPETIEKCGNIPCPQWITTEWTPCRSSKCFAWHTALQKRNVSCSYDNETVSDKCDENEKPTTKQECYNELCKGVWRVEQWSECNAPCNGKGTRYRTLQCVWYGTRKPAGNACNNQPRPAVMKSCSGAPCVVDPNECKDISKYCNNVKTMGLCRLHRFQQTCCSTCKFNIYNKKK
ncbi:hypothetical protein PVAND_005325 [Polypedilum vanderplanki]|uniref:ADAMTS-like protein n=1 Tax=Polypedilum vanderplanki TaxID=319348 RepID=A0A9J6C0S2_POLVA|nr:hypothetical protein PVAND_005325 [Polypedilum vanderplanki]